MNASLNELFNFIDNNKNEIDQAQKLIKTKTQRHYPLMKILDMYFWQIGYDKEGNKKRKGNNSTSDYKGLRTKSGIFARRTNNLVRFARSFMLLKMLKSAPLSLPYLVNSVNPNRNQRF